MVQYYYLDRSYRGWIFLLFPRIILRTLASIFV
jgi:hypothetical protein